MTSTTPDLAQTQAPAMEQWLQMIYSKPIALKLLAGDASFRRFYRFREGGESLIAIDSSHHEEKTGAFAEVNRQLAAIGLHVPTIIHQDLTLGYFVVSDLGDALYQRILNAANADWLYQAALKDLVILQSQINPASCNWPAFDRQLWSWELEQFLIWYWQAYLKNHLTETDKKFWQQQFENMGNVMAKQPMLPAHRDYHSRNLLWDKGRVGIVDFQDACIAPLTYDAVSLLRDCYIDWPENKVIGWLKNYYHLLQENKLASDISFSQFHYWFDITGMQRHLKAIFIFARKNVRDHNPLYLEFIPRALNYIVSVAAKYPQFSAISHWLTRETYP